MPKMTIKLPFASFHRYNSVGAEWQVHGHVWPFAVVEVSNVHKMLILWSFAYPAVANGQKMTI